MKDTALLSLPSTTNECEFAGLRETLCSTTMRAIRSPDIADAYSTLVSETVIERINDCLARLSWNTVN